MELLIMFAAVIVAALISLTVTKRAIIEGASVAALSIVFVAAVSVALRVAANGTYAPYLFFSVDALGAIVMLIVATVGLAATVHSIAYLREEMAKGIIGFTRVRQYFVLLNVFLGAMLLAVSSSNPVFTWISIEATTLSTAFLISFYNKPSAMEAAWKYLIINSVGLLLGFFGTLLYFTSMHGVAGNGFTTWSDLLLNVNHLDPMVAKIAFVFVLIGYGTKAGLAPMHTWLPDAHSKASAPISALLSGVLLNVAFVAMLRFKVLTDAVVGPAFSQGLLIDLGLLSIVVASLIIFTQQKYKRLLAYSSIENMGVLALGFGFSGGVGTFAAILHLLYHSLLKPALFFLAGNIFLKYSSTRIADVRGAITALPVTGVAFIVGFLAITGAPPFGIFFTKLLIFSAGIQMHLLVTVVALAFMTWLFVGFLRHVSALMFGEKPADIPVGEMNVWLVVPPVILLALALYLSVHIPAFLQTLLSAAVTYLH